MASILTALLIGPSALGLGVYLKGNIVKNMLIEEVRLMANNNNSDSYYY